MKAAYLPSSPSPIQGKADHCQSLSLCSIGTSRCQSQKLRARLRTLVEESQLQLRKTSFRDPSLLPLLISTGGGWPSQERRLRRSPELMLIGGRPIGILLWPISRRPQPELVVISFRQLQKADLGERICLVGQQADQS